jgi:putative transposase
LVKKVDEYKWSSFNEYTKETQIVNTDYALAMFSEDRKMALKKFKEFNMMDNNDKCLEITPERKTISDKKIRELVQEKYNIELASLHNEDSKTQIEVLRFLKQLEGSSLRQLSRLTGLTVNKIFRA